MSRPPRPLSLRRPRRVNITPEQLASLSHEFRTPLNGVLGMARLLDATALTAEQRSYVAALRDSGQHLLSLVNDVLDFAKLGDGRIELHPTDVEVDDLLRRCCELLSPRAHEKGIEIAWAAPPSAGVIRADEGRLRQILLNFASNAVKFTDAGGVLLRVEPRGGGRLRFVVEDTGPGVSAEQRERIFEAFTQAEAAHAHLGSGLGLTIARKLAQAMVGEVGVETAESGGALFWFEAAFRQIASDPQPSTLAGRRIGVASPNPIVREAARRQIEACGGEAAVGPDLDAVLARLGETDVVLVDHAFASRGRALKPPPYRRAILLLASEQRDCIPRCRRAGFAGYLVKPLRRASLAERVLIAAGEARAPGPAREDERAAAAAAPGARILLVEDNPINALLARTLLAREGCRVDHAAGGEEALAAAKVGAYDIILMDMRMPGMCGETTARALRGLGVKTPIIALTANAFDEDRRACLAAGMDDFLVKPLSPDDLRAMLTRWRGALWTPAKGRAKLA